MPIWLIGAWKFVRPFLPYILSALAVIALLYGAYSWAWERGAHSRDAEVSALTQTITNLKAASAKAQADNLAHVQTVETKQDQVTKDHANDKPNTVAIGNAAIAEYVRLHPAPQAYSSGPTGTEVPKIPDPANQPDGPSAQAIVSRSDLDACNVAYATAIGLQGWIRDQAAIDRTQQ